MQGGKLYKRALKLRERPLSNTEMVRVLDLECIALKRLENQLGEALYVAERLQSKKLAAQLPKGEQAELRARILKVANLKPLL